MKITKQQLKRIIKEEIETTLNEIEGMSPEKYRQMDPRAALSAAHTEMDCAEVLEKIEAVEEFGINNPTSALNFRKIVPTAKKCDIPIKQKHIDAMNGVLKDIHRYG